MRFFIIITSLLILSCSVSANEELKNEIHDLADDVQRHVWRSRASDVDLLEVKSYLEQAIEKLKGEADPRMKCVEFTLPILSEVYSSSLAVSKTNEACEKVKAIEVYKYVYTEIKQALTTGRSVEFAAESATVQRKHKLNILEFIHDKYKQTLTSTRALEKSLIMIDELVPESLGCLKTYYAKYSRRYSTSRAIELTADQCHN